MTHKIANGQGEGVRALQRGLDILRAVNSSGGIRAGELAQQLNIPRPTVYRLLQTLEELGYVMRGASNDLFRVTRRASSLGDGYDASVVVAQHVGPILFELGRRFIWPFDVSTYENAAMVIQETTHARSPLSIDRGMSGRRLPMVRSSSGRAYLAFCPTEERDLILRHLRLLDDPEDRPFLVDAALERMLKETAARGYAIRDGSEYNPKTASLSVPIRQDAQVLGCLSVIWIGTAMKVPEAIDQLVAPMQQAATQIAGAIGKTSIRD